MSVSDSNAVKNGLKSNPKKFLAENVILVPAPPANLSLSPVRTFDFDYIADPDNREGCYYAGQVAGNGSLTAYYLPWDVNTGYHVVVETNTNVDLMFTAQLSGCAVGYIRASDKSGAVRVSHHNIQTAQGGTDHNAMQNSLSFAQSAIHRNDYRDTDSHIAYVFGVLDNKKWRFYAQKVKQAGLGQYQILEVHEMK